MFGHDMTTHPNRRYVNSRRLMQLAVQQENINNCLEIIYVLCIDNTMCPFTLSTTHRTHMRAARKVHEYQGQISVLIENSEFVPNGHGLHLLSRSRE